MASSSGMAGSLLVRTLPLQGEGLHGYLLQVADANGLLPGLDLFKVLRADSSQPVKTGATAIANAGRLGLRTSELSSLGCLCSQTDATQCLHAGHTTSTQHLRTLQRALSEMPCRATGHLGRLGIHDFVNRVEVARLAG